MDRPGTPASTGRDAEILSWPAEDDRREFLRSQRVPRLLALEAGTLPPSVDDDLEDWIWLPADERDVFARLRRLAGRRSDRRLDADAVVVGPRGQAWIFGQELHLPPLEAALLGCLADPPEQLCTRDELTTAAWGDTPHQRRSLDSRIFVLRRRLEPHGLAVRAIRGRGFVLTRADPGGTS